MAAIHKYPIVIGCKRNLNGYSKDRKKRLDNSLLLYKLTNLKWICFAPSRWKIHREINPHPFQGRWRRLVEGKGREISMGSVVSVRGRPPPLLSPDGESVCSFEREAFFQVAAVV